MLLFLAGAQMAAIGMVGEYVGRIYVQVQGRPPFIVRERVGPSAGDARPEAAVPDRAGGARWVTASELVPLGRSAR